MNKKTSHHHGDLRAALIRSGAELIQDGGVEALTVRKVAAHAGVSHAAPAHHFKHLTDLRNAVAASGYLAFAAAMQAEIAHAGDAPHDIILAAGRGYITFARENPGMFHLMFGGWCDAHPSDELQLAADQAYEVLRQITAPLAPGPAGALGNEILVWSIVHGFSSLLLGNSDNTEFQENALDLFCAIFPKLPLLTPGST